jgi:hypothetical protein
MTREVKYFTCVPVGQPRIALSQTVHGLGPTRNTGARLGECRGRVVAHGALLTSERALTTPPADTTSAVPLFHASGLWLPGLWLPAGPRESGPLREGIVSAMRLFETLSPSPSLVDTSLIPLKSLNRFISRYIPCERVRAQNRRTHRRRVREEWAQAPLVATVPSRGAVLVY